jgi:hypothetical protein
VDLLEQDADLSPEGASSSSSRSPAHATDRDRAPLPGAHSRVSRPLARSPYEPDGPSAAASGRWPRGRRTHATQELHQASGAGEVMTSFAPLDQGGAPSVGVDMRAVALTDRAEAPIYSKAGAGACHRPGRVACCGERCEPGCRAERATLSAGRGLASPPLTEGGSPTSARPCRRGGLPTARLEAGWARDTTAGAAGATGLGLA